MEGFEFFILTSTSGIFYFNQPLVAVEARVADDGDGVEGLVMLRLRRGELLLGIPQPCNPYQSHVDR